MSHSYKELPVYREKQRILKALQENQVIVVQSPTGSGKTTQLPVILHEAGYSEHGVIAVTQPRRIAALSVSEFIAKQLGTTYPGLVGFKMRFEDKTDSSTKIKIMTDGILLQEMKLDPWMSRYSVVMVDEAHERSLNIDFVLGLLKRILKERPEFKVIVSSATMNAEAFSAYFGGCPIVTIDTVTFPVTMIYDPPAINAGTTTPASEDALLEKIEGTIDRILDNRHSGDILCFLPGEKVIKDCMMRLSHARFARKIHLVPLYGRLAKEEQERVFENAPFGRKKVVISTNIAETSVTIPGITAVIDSGLAKLNFYNPSTFTSSLNETVVSKASCAQRKGRAGRTKPGVCYRLYPRKDFETRPMYTTEEIYRTDLSEVVMRMSELGITNMEDFDFISPPSREGLRGAVETLRLLDAVESDNSLSSTGKMMAEFPLVPRVSRIIVESILRYPEVIEEVLIAASFMSAQSPFVLPQGEETDARQAHHRFRDPNGDFCSYVILYRRFADAWAQHTADKFCEHNYLDQRVLLEIMNIKEQLEQIVVRMGLPILSGGSTDDYLTCIASGLIQFVCVRAGKENYHSLTTEHISIHPGSVMFRNEPQIIVAGEIVRTSRMFAMSVSPLSRKVVDRLNPAVKGFVSDAMTKGFQSEKKRSSAKGGKHEEDRLNNAAEKLNSDANSVTIGGTVFEVKTVKERKTAILPCREFIAAARREDNQSLLSQVGKMRGVLQMEGGHTLLEGEKLSLVLKIAKKLDLKPMESGEWDKKLNLSSATDKDRLLETLSWVLRVTVAKEKSKEMGFICLFSDGHGRYWYKACRGLSTALNESTSSLESLIDELGESLTDAEKAVVNATYRRVADLL